MGWLAYYVQCKFGYLRFFSNIWDRFLGDFYTNDKKKVTAHLLSTVFNTQFIYLSGEYCKYISWKSAKWQWALDLHKITTPNAKPLIDMREPTV